MRVEKYDFVIMKRAVRKYFRPVNIQTRNLYKLESQRPLNVKIPFLDRHLHSSALAALCTL